MKAFLALYRRELTSLWVTPLAWILLTCFLLLQGGVFSMTVVHYASMEQLALDGNPISSFFGQNSLLLTLTLLLLCPALSMRTLAEERRSGSIEVLLSAPIHSFSIAFAKFLATFSTYALMWLPTLAFPYLLRDMVGMDLRVIATSYAGILLVGSSYLALGGLASAMTHSQLVALLLSASLELGLFVVGIGEYILDPGPLYNLSAHVSMTTLLEETSRGVLDTRRLVFHGSLLIVSLSVTTKLIESWRTE